MLHEDYINPLSVEVNEQHDEIPPCNIVLSQDQLLTALELSSISEPSPLLRRSQRRKHTPSYLKDFCCNLVHSSHWCIIAKFCALKIPTKQVYVERTSYKEVSSDPLWVETMNQEIEALNTNQTWNVDCHFTRDNVLEVEGLIQVTTLRLAY